MDTIDRIMGLMKSRDITGAKLSRECNLGNAAYYQWKSRRNKPSAEALIKIAAYLDTTVEFLAGQKEEPTPVSESGHSAAAIAFMERHPDLTEEDYRFLHEQAELLELRRIHQEKK